MPGQFLTGLLHALIISSLIVAAAQEAYADDFFDLVESNLTQKDNHPEQAACQRAVYSKSFDAWLKAYTEGRKAAASTAWKGVLAETRGTPKLYELGSQIAIRLQFLDGKQGKANVKLGDTATALEAALDETQKDLGDCRQTSSLANYIASRYVRNRDYKKAVAFEKRALAIQQQAKVRDDAEIFQLLIHLSEFQVKTRDFTEAKFNTEQALSIAAKAHAADGVSVARGLLSQIKTAALVPK